jgi:hypothetical protein
MKTLLNTSIKVCIVLLFTALSVNNVLAQTPKQARKQKEAADIKKLVESDNYIFKANYAYPMRGGSRYLTSEYDMNVVKDSIITYLPYFGRAYIAPIDPMNGGIHFTSTKFDYNVKQNANGSWLVTIKPTDVRYMRQLFLTISADGSATLQITSDDRDPISFEGYIDHRKKSS